MNELSYAHMQEVGNVTISDKEEQLRQRIYHLVNVSTLARILRENLGNDCFSEHLEGLSQVVDAWHERSGLDCAIKTLVDALAISPDDIEDQVSGLCAVADLALEKARHEYSAYIAQ